MNPTDQASKYCSTIQLSFIPTHWAHWFSPMKIQLRNIALKVVTDSFLRQAVLLRRCCDHDLEFCQNHLLFEDVLPDATFRFHWTPNVQKIDSKPFKEPTSTISAAIYFPIGSDWAMVIP